MNYQDFESAWYMGLILTAFFLVMVTGVVMIIRHLRELRLVEGGELVSWLAVGAGVFTFLFLLGGLLAILVGTVGLGSA